MKTQRGSNSSQKRLKEVIMKASYGKHWDEARTEWELVSVFIEEDSKCACGHTIAKNCVIRNTKTAANLIVGNECIKHFECDRLNVGANIFAGLRKITRGKIASSALLDLCIRLEVLTTFEVEKYLSISKKRLRTPRQSMAIKSINELIARRMKNKRNRV